VDIFTSQGAPPVSTTPASKFSTIFPSVVDTSGKFATGVNDTGGTFAAGGWQIATGINDTGSKFAAIVNYTGDKQWEQLSNC
jgi:hypothetical protein